MIKKLFTVVFIFFISILPLILLHKFKLNFDFIITCVPPVFLISVIFFLVSLLIVIYLVFRNKKNKIISAYNILEIQTNHKIDNLNKSILSYRSEISFLKNKLQIQADSLKKDYENRLNELNINFEKSLLLYKTQSIQNSESIKSNNLIINKTERDLPF